MDLSNLIFYALAGVMLVMSLLLFAFAISYQRLYEKYFSLKAEEEKAKKKLETEAQEKLAEMSLFNEKLVEKFDQVYQETLQRLSASILEKSGELSANMVNASQEAVGELKRALQNKVDLGIKSFETSISGKLAEIDRELEDYKAAKVKLIDKKAEELVSKLARELLGRSLDLKDHQDLIMRALEEAKKENVL